MVYRPLRGLGTYRQAIIDAMYGMVTHKSSSLSELIAANDKTQWLARRRSGPQRARAPAGNAPCPLMLLIRFAIRDRQGRLMFRILVSQVSQEH